jgi:hypothetical protein
MKTALRLAASALMLAARAVMAQDVTFHGYQDFGGGSFSANDAIPDLGGTCRSFGPGDYASLPWGLDNAVSSGRRISSENPYSGAPDWRR